MALEFTQPNTKTGYKAIVTKDRKIFVPATDKHADYSGSLSNVTPPVADTMISTGTNLLAKNLPIKPAPEKPSAN